MTLALSFSTTNVWRSFTLTLDINRGGSIPTRRHSAIFQRTYQVRASDYGGTDKPGLAREDIPAVTLDSTYTKSTVTSCSSFKVPTDSTTTSEDLGIQLSNTTLCTCTRFIDSSYTQTAFTATT